MDLSPSRRPYILDDIKKERGQKFYDGIEEEFRKELGCTLVATFGTESSKSAVLTSCRGYRSEEYTDGIDNDIAQYLSSLIPVERGFVWSISDCYYGNEEEKRKPIPLFKQEVDQYPGLLEIMLGVEGLISRRGSHASGVIFNDEDPFEYCAYMRTPSGEVITQYDLHDAEWCGVTKYDFLVTEVQDKILQTIKLLQEDGEIESYLSLKEVYNKYLHPSVLPIDDIKVWKAIQNVEILDLFQFDSTVGSQAARKIKPSSMLELSDSNGLMRLMAMETGETPLDKYVRFKNDISQWYDEMRNDYHLTENDITAVKRHFERSYGVPPSQEQLMTMLMDKDICGFTLAEANTARKIVGKKQLSKVPALHQKVISQAKNENLGKYIWECGIGPQMSYSFSIIHALAYSFIAFQTAYLATRWNPIYWNTACLIVNSGSLEETKEEIVDIYEKEDMQNYDYEDLPDRSGKKKKEKTTDYAKVAKAIGNIRSKGINVSLININTSDYGYKPDVKNNRILYGLKAITGINSEVIEQIKKNRPYFGIADFMSKVKLNKTAMISLIKAGAFDEIDSYLDHNRTKIMAYYISKISKPKTRLTLQNFNGLLQHGLIPQELEMQIRVYNFNKYLKGRKVGLYYTFDADCTSFFERFYSDYMNNLNVINGITCIKQTDWDKIYQKEMDPARDYLKAHQQELLQQYNLELFKEVWEDSAKGNISAWEMDSVCFYYHEHELANIDYNKYGISNFFDLQIGEIDYYFKRGNNQIPIYKLSRIAGTVLAKNDSHASITLLTREGIVDVKMTKDQYAVFKKQVSEVQPDGTKKVIEKSWFKRGNKLMITGYRSSETEFRMKTYKSTPTHSLYHIDSVIGNEITIRHERKTTNNSIEEEEYIV